MKKKEEITLVPEQEVAIDDFYEDKGVTAIKELVALIFPNIDEKFRDGRSVYGKAIKNYLASKGKKAKASSDRKEAYDLNQEERDFIYNNCSTMKVSDMCETLYGGKINPSDMRFRACSAFAKSIDDKVVLSEVVREVSPSDYLPPKTETKAISRINKYVHEGIDKNNIKASDKKNIAKLIAYMHTYRFLHQISNYASQDNRELFESSFVRYTHDKPDLTQEEVDQYIVLSAEVVIASNIQVRVERLQELLDQAAEETEGKRMAMSLVESINTAQTEYNQCVNRQTKLLNELKEKRSQRLSKQIKENASILNLVEMWKDEESRHKMIKLAEIRKKALEEEVERLSTMDEIKCRIMGLTEEEVLNG